MPNKQTAIELATDDPPPVPEQFRVHDEATANWVVRRITSAMAYQKKVAAWADAEIRRAQHEEAWFRRRFGEELVMWTREQIEALKTKRKSINLPAGTLGFRQIAEKLIIDDEEKALKWARRSCPNAVVTSERLRKTVLNEHFASTGEMPTTGVHIEPAAEKFYIR
jgi:phage host-nuclease inhibitor protein Gam